MRFQLLLLICNSCCWCCCRCCRCRCCCWRCLRSCCACCCGAIALIECAAFVNAHTTTDDGRGAGAAAAAVAVAGPSADIDKSRGKHMRTALTKKKSPLSSLLQLHHATCCYIRAPCVNSFVAAQRRHLAADLSYLCHLDLLGSSAGSLCELAN